MCCKRPLLCKFYSILCFRIIFEIALRRRCKRRKELFRCNIRFGLPIFSTVKCQWNGKPGMERRWCVYDVGWFQCPWGMLWSPSRSESFLNLPKILNEIYSRVCHSNAWVRLTCWWQNKELKPICDFQFSAPLWSRACENGKNFHLQELSLEA